MNLNKAIIAGRLTRAPEVRTTPSGQSVASFGVATNRIWNNQQGEKQEQVEFHNVVVWGRLAEIAGQYLTKGQLIIVEGRLQTSNWEQDGIKKYKTEIIAENFQMGPRSGQSTQSNQGGDEYSQSDPNKSTPPPVPPISNGVTGQAESAQNTSVPSDITESTSKNQSTSSEQEGEQNSDNGEIKVEDIPF